MTTSQGRDRDTRGGGGGRPGTRRFSGRRRRQCVCKEVGSVDYKDISVLRRFISDRGRMESGRKSGNCAKCQRELSTAISRARFLGLLPYAPNHIRVTGSITPAAPASSDSDSESESTEAKSEEESTESTTEAPVAEETDSDESSSEESKDESDDTSASVESSEDTEESVEEASEEDADAETDSDDSDENDDSDDEEKS